MLKVRWDTKKSEKLRESRGIGFEELLLGKPLRILEHPQRRGQYLLLVEYRNYIWVVPYVEDGKGIFLKTLFPSRKYTKLYFGRKE